MTNPEHEPPTQYGGPSYGQQPGPGQQPPYGQQPYGYGVPAYAPKHPSATMAMVLGILGLVLCSVAAPFAWWIGAKAVREIDQSGGQYAGRGEALAGKIMGIIGSVLMILGILATVAYVVVLILLYANESNI